MFELRQRRVKQLTLRSPGPGSGPLINETNIPGDKVINLTRAEERDNYNMSTTKF